MKLSLFFGAILLSGQVLGVDNSASLSNSGHINGYEAQVLKPFELSDGKKVLSSDQIEDVVYSTATFGSGSTMVVKVDNKNYTFKLEDRVYVENKYPYGRVNVAPSTTGQNLGVKLNHSAIGNPFVYERNETSSCYGRSFSVCLPGRRRICDHYVRPSGSQEELVEYSEQDQDATLTLSNAQSEEVAKVFYKTKEFDKRVLRVIYRCDADSYENRSNARRRAIDSLRRRHPRQNPPRDGGRRRRPRH